MKLFFIILLFINFSICFAHPNNTAIDSLESKITTTKNDTQLVSLYNDLGLQYRQVSISKSIEYLRKALTLSDSIDYKYGQIRSYILLGIVHKTSGSFDKAIDYLLKGLKIAEKKGNKAQISICYNNIGNIYHTQKNYTLALEYYKKSLHIEEHLENKEQISIRYYNIGTVYELTDSLDKAYSYYYNSLILEQELENKEGVYYALYGIAGVDIQNNRYNSAMENISKALEIAITLKDPMGMALCYNEQGKLFREIGLLDKSVSSFKTGIFYADSVNYLAELKEIFYELSKTYLLQNNFKNAYKYLNKYKILNDSINSIEISTKIAELSAKYEIEKKEQEIKFLEQQHNLEKVKAKTEKKNRYFLIVSFILAIALTLSNLGRVLEGVKLIILYSSIVLIIILITTFIIFYTGSFDETNQAYLIFTIFVDVLTYSILPIFIFVLIAERILLNKRLKTAQNLSEQIKDIEKPEGKATISLFAENEKTNISLSLDKLLYVEANDNYSNIYFQDDKEIKREIMRISLKRLEIQLNNYKEIVRCHKSYIINLMNIEKITGNAQGYKLLIKNTDFRVPVSRNFPKEMIEKLKAIK